MKTTKFKPSEVGPIPEEWEVKALGEVGVFSKGLGVSRSESNSGALPCVRYGEIYTDYNDYIKEFRSFISEKVAAGAKLMSPGDILFAGSGETKEEIGKTVAFLGGVDRAYCGGDILILSPSRGYDSKFLGYVCNSQPIVAQKASRGQGDAVVHIRSGSLAEVVIPVPPRPEQEKIAEALSDVDGLLAAMTKLIEKKHAIKQGAMQQLLTGKKRLAGFTGKWVEKRLGDVVEINPSLESVIPEKFVYVDLESVAGGRLLERKLVLRERAPSRAQRRFVQGDILFQTVRPYQRNNLLVGFDAANYVASTGYAVIRGRALCSCSEFIYHIIHVDDFVNGVLDRCTGTSYPAINPGKLAEIIVRIPEAVAEQRAIASVLSDMDAEIAALEAKRAKYESIKQGMMQELLTGKTRLM